MQSTPIVDSIRPVATNLQSVTVHDDVIESFAEDYSGVNFEVPAWDSPVHPDMGADPEYVVDYFVVGNALNFHFNSIKTGEKWAVEHMDGEWSGSFGLWAAMDKAFQEGVDLTDAETLTSLSFEEMLSIFASSNNTQLPLLEERYEMLREVGDVMQTELNGSFMTLLDSSDGYLYNNGTGLLERLPDTMNAYEDAWAYNGEIVVFNKRAQLAIAMIYDRFVHTSSVTFDVPDLEKMTVFADYGVPATLRSLGIISYDADIADAVDSGERIPAGSREELEIRAATVWAGEKLLDALNRSRESASRVTAPELDYFLWEMREDAGETHLTETTA